MNALVAGIGSYIVRPCGHDLHGPTVSIKITLAIFIEIYTWLLPDIATACEVKNENYRSTDKYCCHQQVEQKIN